MIVYVVSRKDGDRTAIWSPFRKLEKAMGMVDTHLKFRVAEGATLQRRVSFTPDPIKEGSKVRVGTSNGVSIYTTAPEIVECCIHESELINENGEGRSVYRVCQHVIVE